ncbi:hypothetical protein scyTo_0004986 [Scyliorhinus torazame]|uniref:Proline-rich transmembrane protein 3/4 domain-containing protein n=1 Tax=Scyliorhinus torazame TaxID=75743 RepID=A0A401P0B1_SCYTO|nr:hypothetical protein [Scyliorhinus torazame]
MAHQDVLWAWGLLLIYSSITQAMTSPPTKEIANDISIFNKKSTKINSTEVEDSLTPVPPRSSSILSPQPKVAISNKDSVHARPVSPTPSSISSWYPSLAPRGNAFDFSGDDEDVDSEDDFDVEEPEKDIFKSEQFIFANTSAPLVIATEVNGSADYTLLGSFESTPDYQTVQTHQNPINSQDGNVVDAITFLQGQSATSPNNPPVFDVGTRHTILAHTETVQATAGLIVALGNTSPTLTLTPSATGSYQSPGKQETVVQFEGPVTVRATPRGTGKPGIHNVMTTTMGGQSGNNGQSATTKRASNTSTSVNISSSKEHDSQHGSERKNIIPINAQKPGRAPDSKLAIGNHSDENKPYSQLCSTQDRECVSNKTSAQWNDLKRTLGFVWEMHVYGAGILFVILMLLSLINLISSPILYVPDIGYLMAANGLLFALALLRAVYLFFDPYGSKSKLPPVGSLVLYNVTFPLLITTFGILILLLLKTGKLQMLSSKIQNPALLAVIAVIHFVVLISGDLLYSLLNPAVNIVLHIFSVSWGSFLIFAFFLTYRKLKSRSEATIGQIQKPTIRNEESLELQNQERALKRLLISSRVMAVGGVFGFLCCALQVYAILWIYGILGEKGRFYWSWWFLQFWYRSFEIAISFAMCFVTSYAFCQQQGRPDYICWSKIVQYFHHYRKRETPEYPNNCYDWSSGTQDRVTGNDICKNLIRNQAESMPLKTLNETNESKPKKSYYNNDGSMISLDHRPRIPVLGPKSHNLMMGRSFTSICIEKESVLSLNVFDLRPPSPINLSRSIDEALFREHIVRDSVFHTSGLRCPSYLSMEDSCSSLRTHKALDQGKVTVASSKFNRRNSDPDYLYSTAKCSSLNNVQMDTSKQSIQDLERTQAANRLHRSASSSSLDSASKTSFGIHWYSWTRNPSSGESVPSVDPASESLLPQNKSLDNSEVKLKTEDPDIEAQKSFIEIRVIDDVSLSSDTIEL